MSAPYATVADLVARFGEREIAQRSSRDGRDVIDEAVVGQALADANAEAHGYIATRYPVPFSPVPPLLVRVVCDIARYRLYDDAAPEEVRKRYEDAARLLTRIADGSVSIGPPEASPSHPQTVAVVAPAPGLFARRPNGGLRG